MAKNSTVRTGGGPARVRLVVLDAEIPDGDLGAFNQVLQNALRGPTTTVVQQRVNGGVAKTLTHQPTPESDEEVEATVEEVVEEDIGTVAQPKQSRARKTVTRAPNVIDIDMNSPTSLATFAQGKDAKSQHKKFMIAAAWLKEHRNTDAITADHVYTCFKSMGWSTNIPDFGLPLRDLKNKLQYFAKSEKGYEINHIGLDFVKKLGGRDGTG